MRAEHEGLAQRHSEFRSKMKIHKDCKIEKVTSQDPTRPVLSKAYLDGDKLVATDGRVIVVLPVTPEDGDTSGYITEEALKQARKTADRKTGIASLACNGQLTAGGVSMPRPTENDEGMHKYPNWRQVIPKAEESDIRLNLDVSRLFAAAQAMGVDCLTLTIPKEGSGGQRRAILIVPYGTNKNVPVRGASGVLMMPQDIKV